MSRRYVRKEGRVHNVYNTPFSEWDSPPEGEFPNTVLAEDENQLKQQIGSDYVIIDRPAPPEVKAAPRLPLGALLGALAGMGIPQEKIAKIAEAKNVLEVPQPEVVTLPHKVSQKALAQVNIAVELQDKMLQEFRVVAAVGNKEEIEHVGSFILAVCPDLEAELRTITSPTAKKRFTL